MTSSSVAGRPSSSEISAVFTSKSSSGSLSSAPPVRSGAAPLSTNLVSQSGKPMCG